MSVVIANDYPMIGDLYLYIGHHLIEWSIRVETINHNGFMERRYIDLTNDPLIIIGTRTSYVKFVQVLQTNTAGDLCYHTASKAGDWYTYNVAFERCFKRISRV